MEKVTEQHYRGKTPSRAQSTWVWPWARIIVAYALLEWALWSPDRGMQEIASLVFIAWVVITTAMQRRRLGDLGLGLSGIRGAAIAIPVALVAAGCILLA